jgi:hypothetical protein
MRRARWRRAGALLALAGGLAFSVPASHLAVANPSPQPVMAEPAGAAEIDATGLDPITLAEPADGQDGYRWLNYFRALGGLSPVSRDATLEAQEASHVRYLADHALSCETDVHDELTSPQNGCGANPYATAAGKLAANNSDITRLNSPATDRVAVQNWFVAGFHALTLLEPRLRRTGYAAYYTPHPTGAGPEPYQFTAAVDVYRGRTGSYRGGVLTFPAAGATSPLLGYRVGTESPEPFGATLPGSRCHGWAGRELVSAPIIVQWPVAARPVQAPAVIVDVSSNRPLPTCALTAADYPSGSLARTFLLGTNRVTQAALYYAAAPFVPGHRYRLLIGRTVLTDFVTTSG